MNSVHTRLYRRQQATNMHNEQKKGLSLIFATFCIIDLFGVFPIIALPRAIIECGWLGIPLALLVFSIQIYTAVMLGRCWTLAEKIDTNISNKSRYPYSALVELAYGCKASRYVKIILGLAIFGGSVPNLQVGKEFTQKKFNKFLKAAQNLELIGLKMSFYNMDFSYCYWIIIIGTILCPVMWLGSPKDFRWLGLSSVAIVLTSSVLTWYCLIEEKEQDVIIPKPNWEAIGIASGILAFQFDVHPMILTVQMDMKRKNQLGKAIFAAFIASGVMFLVTVLICYIRYGTSIRYNTLQGLSSSGSLYADFVLVTIQIGLSTVVGACPLFQDLEQWLNISTGFGWKRCVLRTSILATIVLVAEMVPRFDLVMSLVGGSLMGQIMFIIPPLLYARLRSMHAAVNLIDEVEVHRSATYGTIPTETKALITTSHYRTDISMEDRLDRNELFLRRPIKRNYKKEEDDYLTFVSLENVLHYGPLSICEKMTNVLIIIFGILATVMSTYYSLKGAIQYADFAPPCIVDVVLASRLIYKQV